VLFALGSLAGMADGALGLSGGEGTRLLRWFLFGIVVAAFVGLVITSRKGKQIEDRA
jgi:hypothetical protein